MAKIMKTIMNALIAAALIATLVPGMAYDITANDWKQTRGNLNPTVGFAPTGPVIFAMHDDGEMSQNLFNAYQAANTGQPRALWDNYLGGVPLAPCDPSLKTTDPIYLNMGAMYDSNYNAGLPVFLQ